MKFEIAWARNDEGERIRALLAQDGLHINGANWADIEGYWLVARAGGEVQACLGVAFGKPISRLDFMSIDNGVKGLSRSRMVRAILASAIAVCLKRGSSLAAGLIPYTMSNYAEVLMKRGGTVINEGQLIVTPLYETLDAIGE